MAVWEKEGWGTTNDCLQMVVDNYKTQGTTDRHSVNALESYLRRLTPPAFKVITERNNAGAGRRIQQRNCDLAGDRRKPARTGQNRHGAAGRIKAGDRKTESGDLRHSFKEWRYLKKGETKK